MALTERQKHEVIRHLGWAGKTLIADSTHYNSIVNSRLINLNDEIERQVAGLLARLDALERQLDSARCRLTASKVNGIETNSDELELLVKEYWRWLRALSDLLDIKIEKRRGNVNMGVVV